MNKLYSTISEISRIFTENNVEFVLARFNSNNPKEPDDLDFLVKPNSFERAIKVLEENGYRSSSHDEALGGRIKGMQKNLTRQTKIKIDLHQDFTWRKTQYFDLSLVWDNLRFVNFSKVRYPAPKVEVDTFLVIVNLIFEKTYIQKEDLEYIRGSSREIFTDPILQIQARKYGWERTFSKFSVWFDKLGQPTHFPRFLPVSLILYSYLEKFLHDKRVNVISLLYYVFFRIRFNLNGVLPYE